MVYQKNTKIENPETFSNTTSQEIVLPEKTNNQIKDSKSDPIEEKMSIDSSQENNSQQKPDKLANDLDTIAEEDANNSSHTDKSNIPKTSPISTKHDILPSNPTSMTATSDTYAPFEGAPNGANFSMEINPPTFDEVQEYDTEELIAYLKSVKKLKIDEKNFEIFRKEEINGVQWTKKAEIFINKSLRIVLKEYGIDSDDYKKIPSFEPQTHEIRDDALLKWMSNMKSMAKNTMDRLITQL
ncbi:10798_t:CDS:2 [Diversispora eburnea]|uniref:10798_t:CDS:1 n=1 Tax=Diversispora eburnea TaxID=1213867 RepID=A0A9N8W9D6_9GLOM|nr:10798_t:CDS:2 [Diversispora eburnea]